MIPRECDNDDCDYETGVRNGRPMAWWVHVSPCAGPVSFGQTNSNSIDERDSLAFFKGYE